MKKIYSLLMALCMVFSASANAFVAPAQLDLSNVAKNRVAKKINVENVKKSVTTMQLDEAFTMSAQLNASAVKGAKKAPAATTGLQYDATEGSVDRTYTTNDKITINKGEGSFQVLAYAADGTDMTGLLIFGQEDENTIIPVGTYEINATEAEGTVLASSGVSGGSVNLSFYAPTNASGQIKTPLYFIVEGTVEVTAADGKLNIAVDAVNSNNLPVKIACEYDLNTKQGLPYDAQSGSVDRTYSDEDQVVLNTNYVESDGELYLKITAADGSDMVSLAFFVEGLDPVTSIPVGTYPVTNTGEKGTVYASPGVQNGSVYPSFYGKLAANGGITTPLYFLEGGNVIVENVDGHVKVTVAAVNSYDVPINIVYEASSNNGGEEEEKGLPYDATAEDGELNRTYGAADQIFFTTDFLKDYGMLFVDVKPADNSEILCVGFMADAVDSQITIAPGTYEISASGEVGTVMASTGLTEDGYITESYFATLTAEGGITLPVYYLVSGTVVVENVDGQFKMTVDAVNSNGIPVKVVYDPTAGSGNDKTPLQYDATEGEVNRTYTSKETTIQAGEGYFQVMATAADGSDKLGLVLFGDKDENTIIPVGTYTFDGTQEAGTALASTGLDKDGYLTYSFYGKMNSKGQITVPVYWLVGGTVEVSAADGKLTIEVKAVNSYDVPVNIVCEYDLNTKQGLQYDMTEGSLKVNYTDDDKVELNTDYVATDGLLYLDITAADGSNMISVAFWVNEVDPTITIPAGTYPINDTYETGTVAASVGVQNGSVYPSFYGNLNAKGQITTPCYFMVDGNVVVEDVEGALKVTINALNSYDVPATIVYQADPVTTGVENVVTDTNNATKVIENSQLLIMKDGVKYNVIGSVVK